MRNLIRRPLQPEDLNIDQKITLGLSLWLLLAVTFTLNYLTHTYYSNNILDWHSIGYWLFMLNNIFLGSAIIFTKRALPLSWSELGLGKPGKWWNTVLATLITFAAVVLFAKTVQPLIMEVFGSPQNTSYLHTIRGNLPKLISVLITVWVTAAFLEEVIFRAFIINTLEILLGKSALSTSMAVVISAVIFGGIHAYQGISGILITTCIGLIFGIVFIFNGRRIWPLILVHGIVDTIALVGIYYS